MQDAGNRIQDSGNRIQDAGGAHYWGSAEIIGQCHLQRRGRVRRPDQPLIYAAFGPLISADQCYAVSVNQRLICQEISAHSQES